MISLTYNTPFLLCIFLCSISKCCALTSCTFFLCDDGKTITSTGEIKFQLGFFTPKGNSNKNRYVGIWYLSNPEIVVWVANRDNPLPENSAGSFGIENEGDGNLQLFDEEGNSYFSTELEDSQSYYLRTTRLLEGGNLVVSDESSGKVVWQSFDHPTDTFLPGMKMSESIKLTSWKSIEDPSKGNYRFEQGEAVNGGYVVMNGTLKYLKRGGQSRIFATNSKMYERASNLLNNFNPMRKVLLNQTFAEPSDLDFNKTRLVISWQGEIQYFRLNSNDNKSWVKTWWDPQTRCSVYNTCGKFGTCRSDNETLCDCLPRFKPVESESWESGDYIGGCTREEPILCEEGNNMFLWLNVIKMEREDYYSEAIENETMCRKGCLNNCLCQAYSYRNEADKRNRSESGSSGKGCYIWESELVDIQVGNAINVHNISIKVAKFTIGAIPVAQNESKGTHPQNKSLSRQVVITMIIGSVIAMVLLVCTLSYIYHRKKVAKRKERRRDIIGNTVTGSHQRQLSEEEKGNIDVPFFDLKSILAATDSFSDANKLGEGGFGPVYKGTFSGGREIAVKRLSVHSMQGLEELKNEVVLIAKLQHRNLVRLLGYCIEGDENILLYEYMPNKSLDAFIFDQNSCVLLDWEKRFEIIMGVARGLLYIHQDSRLRIIHRDLKASNILLDEDMNPKISDFGLAKIVGGRDTEANTNRIVGTYGYMSPEYALEGLFSIKSDVFSFGVVVLEIISGKKNTGFYRNQHDLNLLGYTWRLWKEGNPLGIMDETIAECCNKNEVLRCITIGLLCIQEDPNDRPNMSNIVLMLGSSDIENFRSPKRPAFVTRTNQQILSNNDLKFSHQQILSNNELTLSLVKPR